MPLISYPSVNIGRHPDESADTVLSLPVDRTELVLDTPGRIVHESPETRDAVVINRGPSMWTLTLTFGQVEVGTELFREFERWLAKMHDLRNYSPIPLGQRVIDLMGISSTTFTVSARTGATLSLTYTGDLSGQYIVGDMWTVGGRLAMLESEAIHLTPPTMSFNPAIGAVGDTVSIATTALCRLAGDGRYRLTSTGGLTDPITVPFQEVLF